MITTVTLNASIDKAYHMNGSIQNGEVMRVAACNNSAGGKGLNVARVVKLCEREVKATGMVGGFNGAYLESLLDKDRIKHQFFHIKGETRSCINILDESYGSTEYLEPGCEVTEEECHEFLTKVFPDAIKDSKVITISGSTPEGINPDIYARMVQIVKSQGSDVILDTSGELLKNGLKAKPTMVKPNQDEIEMLFQVKISGIEDVKMYAKRIHDMGIPFVVISLGKEGAMMVCQEGIFHAVPPSLPIINTVGCGDSMVGAFAAAMEQHFSPEAALKYAVAIASANACTPDTGNFDPAMSSKILEQVIVERI